ncbi:MAG: hypothetical protein AAFV53_30195 [Myxococcota bacterium]
MRAWMLPLLLSLAASPSFARRPPTDPAPPTIEEREAVFGDVDEILKSGEKKEAASGLVQIAEDEGVRVALRAEAYARLAGLLKDLNFPYAGLIAASKALRLDAEHVSSTSELVLELSRTTGDIELAEDLFAENVGIQVNDEIRGTIALMAARSAHRRGQSAVASAVLKLVPNDHPEKLEAKLLEGVVLSMQGRHQDALIPLQIAIALANEQRRDDPRFRNALQMNLARAYFGAGNFPAAIENYIKVDRDSEFWPTAQFERAWAHFRFEDINGTLSQLQTLQSPFFEDWYFPEADLLRIYSLFLMCKFPEANKQIEAFAADQKPVFETLQSLAARPADDLYTDMKAHIDGESVELPPMITRLFEEEDRFLDNRVALQRADAELKRVRSMQEAVFAQKASQWLNARHDTLSATEADRVKGAITRREAELGQMLNDAELFKLDILRQETRLYEAASAAGAIPDPPRKVRRDVRTKKNQLFWPFQGEYWADEAGYYRIETAPECPDGLTPGQ